MKVRATIGGNFETVDEDDVKALKKLEPAELAIRLLQDGTQVKATIKVVEEK